MHRYNAFGFVSLSTWGVFEKRATERHLMVAKDGVPLSSSSFSIWTCFYEVSVQQSAVSGTVALKKWHKHEADGCDADNGVKHKGDS